MLAIASNFPYHVASSLQQAGDEMAKDADNQIGLTLNGTVHIDEFAKAVVALRELIEGLTKELAPNSTIEWRIDYLSASSADVLLVGEAPPEERQILEVVVDGYRRTGQALELGETVPFKSARKPAQRLRDLINTNIESIDLTAGADVATISQLPMTLKAPVYVESFGVIIGKLQTLSSAHGYRAVILDHVTGHAVRISLDETQKGEAHDLWDEIVAAQGMIRRNRYTGLPQSMREITRLIRREPVAPGAYRSAAGVAPRPEGAPNAEEAVRRIRDA
ncbi:MAG: hypothetical protein H0T94_02040 [Acidimicrobiia bacterium]|nr:hypothetical protein [Acidimicrobiia bacterium]